MLRRPSVHPFQRSSPKPLGQSKPDFMWSLHGSGERKFVRGSWVTWPRWPPCPYMVKALQKPSLEPKGQWPWFVALGPWLHQSLFKWWPWVDLDLFYAFVWEKLLESHLMEETCSKWPEWHEVYVYIKILTPGGCLPLPWGYIHVQKQAKMFIKSDFKEIFLKLTLNGQSDKVFLLTSKFCPQGVVYPCPGAIYRWKNIKKYV